MGKAVLRLCISCRELKDREGMHRIMTEHKSNTVILNPTKKQFGRSAYLCKSESCIKKIKKNKRFKGIYEMIVNYKEIDGSER